MSDLVRILAVLTLVAANAFFVVGEYAVVVARRSRLQEWAESGRAGAAAALRLMNDPVRVISTVQVGITAVAILTGAVGEPLVRDVLGDGLPTWLAAVIAFAVVTYLTVVLGELVPKTVTLAQAERLAVMVAPLTELLSTVLRPAVWVLERSGQAVLRPFGIRSVVAGSSIRSVEELRSMIDEAEDVGVIATAQEELLYNVFDFAGREARDVMRPALSVDWLEADLRVGEALDRVVEAPHDRYPVGDGSIDRVVGVVHVRDLLTASRREPSTRVRDLARHVYLIPETKDLGALLAHWRRESEQFAVVLDEYGAVAGIVTLRDVSEEIIGNLGDEFDLPDDRMTWVDERTVQVAGSMTIDDFNETLGTTLPQDGPRTLAGLVLDRLGHHPRPGEVAGVDGVRIAVEAVDALRITRLAVTLPAPHVADRTGV
jgi:magnesium and cobalt exporter, CNNM family